MLYRSEELRGSIWTSSRERPARRHLAVAAATPASGPVLSVWDLGLRHMPSQSSHFRSHIGGISLALPQSCPSIWRNEDVLLVITWYLWLRRWLLRPKSDAHTLLQMWQHGPLGVGHLGRHKWRRSYNVCRRNRMTTMSKQQSCSRARRHAWLTCCEGKLQRLSIGLTHKTTCDTTHLGKLHHVTCRPICEWYTSQITSNWIDRRNETPRIAHLGSILSQSILSNCFNHSLKTLHEQVPAINDINKGIFLCIFQKLAASSCDTGATFCMYH